MTGRTDVRGTFLECGSVFPETGDHCFAQGEHNIHESEHLYYRWRDDGELVPTPHFSTPEFAAIRQEALERRAGVNSPTMHAPERMR